MVSHSHPYGEDLRVSSVQFPAASRDRRLRPSLWVGNDAPWPMEDMEVWIQAPSRVKFDTIRLQQKNTEK